MAQINVGEDDFRVVAGAAYDAYMKGDEKDAKALDKLARKINAALTNSSVNAVSPFGRTAKSASWKDMPSTIELLADRTRPETNAEGK